MTWQLTSVVLVVAAAALYLGWSAWRTWKGTKVGCGGGCGCKGTTRPAPGLSRPTLIPPEQLALRRRDGEQT